jgi:hypothetical protein
MVIKLWADDTLILQFPITLRTAAMKGMKSQTNIDIYHFWLPANLSVVFPPKATKLNYDKICEIYASDLAKGAKAKKSLVINLKCMTNILLQMLLRQPTNLKVLSILIFNSDAMVTTYQREADLQLVAKGWFPRIMSFALEFSSLAKSLKNSCGC